MFFLAYKFNEEVLGIVISYTVLILHELVWQVKNIAMEILDFYDSHKLMTEDRVNAALHKLPA